jgi:hypothetical protein
MSSDIERKDSFGALRGNVVAKVVHIDAHKVEAAAGILKEVFGLGGVGDLIGFEALALVLYANDELVAFFGYIDSDELGRIAFICVDDRVCASFRDCEEESLELLRIYIEVHGKIVNELFHGDEVPRVAFDFQMIFIFGQRAPLFY